MMYDEIDRLTQERATTFTFSESESEKILFPQAAFTQGACSESFSTLLEQLRRKETRSLLHGTVLSQYWRNSRIPRGLRIYKEPTLGRDNPEFCKKWCSILNKCSLDLMLLVIENENAKLSKVRMEINILEREMSDELSSDRLHEIVDDCNNKMETYKRELEQQKMAKYRRDALDYREDRVYPWLSGRTKKPPRHPRSISRSASTSASSEGISTDTESSNQRFLRSGRKLAETSLPPRGGGRKRGGGGGRGDPT